MFKSKWQRKYEAAMAVLKYYDDIYASKAKTIKSAGYGYNDFIYEKAYAEYTVAHRALETMEHIYKEG